MPFALDLGGLYESLLREFIPLQSRKEETIQELVSRLDFFYQKLREIDQAKSKLAKEKQFNRKVEISSAIRKLNDEINKLVS